MKLDMKATDEYIGICHKLLWFIRVIEANKMH